MRANQPRLVAFGEILIRLSPPDRQLIQGTDHLKVHVGGAEANVAVALASLGHDVDMVSRLPANDLGRKALHALRGAGVDCRNVTHGSGRMGLYFLTQGAGARASEIIYDREGSSFATSRIDDFAWDAIFAGATHLHLSGITPALGAVPAQIALAAVCAAKAKGLTVIFDGNYRAQLWESWDSDPRGLLTDLVAKADIFFGNHRDISLLLGQSFQGDGPERRREAALAAFAAFPNLSLIASTARHIESSDHHRIAARIDTSQMAVQTEEVAVSGIVDRIGAGDAFAAGILHVLMTHPEALKEAVETGLALTILKHSLPGDACTLTRESLSNFGGRAQDVRR